MDFWKMPGWYFDVNDAAGDQSHLCQGEKFETGFKRIFRSNKGCLSVFVHVIIILSVFFDIFCFHYLQLDFCVKDSAEASARLEEHFNL